MENYSEFTLNLSDFDVRQILFLVYVDTIRFLLYPTQLTVKRKILMQIFLLFSVWCSVLGFCSSLGGMEVMCSSDFLEAPDFGAD